MEMHYEVRYRLNGEEGMLAVEAASAAAASETVRQQMCGENDDYELIQVQLMENESASKSVE